MLSIQEVTLYTKLVRSGDAPPINCPFVDGDVDEHIVMSKVDEESNVYFKCLSCNTNFKLGIRTEKIIKYVLDKLLNQG